MSCEYNNKEYKYERLELLCLKTWLYNISVYAKEGCSIR